jgi:hypothetical protein
MSNPIPGLRGTSQQALYPFTRIVSCNTLVTTFMNGSEQRFVSQVPLTHFVLPMSFLSDTDRTNYLSWISGVKGQFAQNITLTLGTTTYSNLTWMDDSLDLTSKMSSGYYDQQIVLRQVQNGSYTVPSGTFTSYPTFSWGGSVQLPFEQLSNYMTGVVDQPSGPRYAYSWYGAGLTNFPTGFLRTWKLSYPLLSDADVATLENFFRGCQGRYLSFSFTDPVDSTTYTHVRFNQDDLQIKYLTKNQSTTEVTLLQTFGS